MTMSRLGCARPVSMKLRCRAETSASIARASWLRRRRSRHWRRRWPTGLAVRVRVFSMSGLYTGERIGDITCEVIGAAGAGLDSLTAEECGDDDQHRCKRADGAA